MNSDSRAVAPEPMVPQVSEPVAGLWSKWQAESDRRENDFRLLSQTLNQLKNRLQALEEKIKQTNLLAAGKSQQPSGEWGFGCGLGPTPLLGPVIRRRSENPSAGDQNQSSARNQHPSGPAGVKPCSNSLDAKTVDQFFGKTYFCADSGSNSQRPLEDKLRQTEIEMSVQRARVFQQRAALEEIKLQLEQREATVRRSVDELNNSDPSLRLQRHIEQIRRG